MKTEPRAGEIDIAAAAPLVGDPSRARLLLALMDERALPASVLAAEVGLSAPATSAHLTKLLTGGLLEVERAGRHRYYALAGPEVADLVEALARFAPARPIRSLRQGTRAEALRTGRTCYDHLAGRLGVAVTSALVERGALVSSDQQHRGTHRRPGDVPAGALRYTPYDLGPAADDVFAALGVDLPALVAAPSRRPLLRFCVDWSEQRHHLAGRLGAALTTALLEGDCIARRPQDRAITLTDRGASLLRRHIGCDTT